MNDATPTGQNEVTNRTIPDDPSLYAEYRFPSYIRGEIQDVVQNVFNPKQWWVVTDAGKWLIEESELERVENAYPTTT